MAVMEYLLPEDERDADYLLVCPYCGFEFTHADGCGLIDGKDSYKATPDKWVRGDVVQVPFWGECGHKWLLQIGQHKGQTFVRSVKVED